MTETVLEVPTFVENHEDLVRTCGSGDIKGGGRVHHRAFMSQRYPFEISLHREAYCAPHCRDRAKAAVRASAGRVRSVATNPTVTADHDPEPDHCVVMVPGIPNVASRVEAQLSEHATWFKRHDQLCRELAAISIPIEREQRSS